MHDCHGESMTIAYMYYLPTFISSFHSPIQAHLSIARHGMVDGDIAGGIA